VVLALLTEGGLPADRAAWTLDLLPQFATMTAAEHATRRRARDASEQEAELARALKAALPEDHPHIAAPAGPTWSSASARERRTGGSAGLIKS
jgi:hypothetical protein